MSKRQPQPFDRCRRCGAEAWLEKHHILPQNVFKGIGPVVYLCPNCHTDYHKRLGRKNEKNPDQNFHFQFYAKWFAGLISLCGILLGVYHFFYS